MRQRGFSLVELMVALTLGSFLIVGAVTVYVRSRNTYSVNETVARLQENARYAMSTIEPDIRLANYWGLMNDPELITGTATNVPLGSGATTNDCGADFDIDLRTPIDGINNDYDLLCTQATVSNPAPGFNRTPDTVVVRHAAETTTVAEAGRLQLYTTRQGAGSQLFNDATAPGAPAALVDAPPNGPQAEVRDLVVRAYYVSSGSSRAQTPSLRRKSLVGGATGPAFMDEEIMPGVEDMQIQFGVDTDPVDGNDRGIVDRYVNADDAIITPDADILSVRVWLRLRADRPEIGLPVDAGFTYADQVVGPFNDGFRRIVVSRTIYLRNARPSS